MAVALFKSGIPHFCRRKKIKNCLLKKDRMKSEYGLRNVLVSDIYTYAQKGDTVQRVIL